MATLLQNVQLLTKTWVLFADRCARRALSKPLARLCSFGFWLKPKPKSKPIPILNLPCELLFMIDEYLPPHSTILFSRCCKKLEPLLGVWVPRGAPVTTSTSST